MAVDPQTVIDAMIRALEAPPHEAQRLRKPVIVISRSVASLGDEVAKAVAQKLQLDCFDREILDGIAAEANVSKTIVESLTDKLNAVDSRIYSAISGKPVTRDDYLRFITTIVRGLYHTGGVICGRGAHLILAGRDILRVRIVGSDEVCAARLAEAESVNFTEAKREVVARNRRREKFLSEVFGARYDDPTTFDIIINTDHFASLDDIVAIVLAAAKARGLAIVVPQQRAGVAS